MPDIRVSVNLDKMKLGDYENMMRGRVVDMIGRCVEVEGWKDVRQVPIKYWLSIADALTAAVNNIDIENMISPVPADNISITDVDELTIGDLECLETGKGMIDLFRRCAVVNGYDDVGEVPFKALVLIRDSVSDAINEAANPNA